MKRFFSFLLSAALIAGSAAVVPASALETDVTLRVGLYYGSDALSQAQLENVSGEATGYIIGTMDGTIFQPDEEISNMQLTMRVSGGAIQVCDTNSGRVLYTAPAGAELAIRPNSTLTWCKGYKWYGDFVYRIVDGSQIAVINYVNIEDYVKGVLPYEVNADWPAEALKAQAVCARSFALGTSKHQKDGFDLCNTTNCQVYLGANQATSNSDSAVDATRGEYITYQGEPVIGYFFSSDGGATEDAANVWGGDYPYLKGKVDPYEDVENAYNGVWSVTLTADDIQDKLQSAGHSIGTVVNVVVTKRTATDNVAEVTITDEDGGQVKLTKSEVRTVFGLNSIRYKITPHVALNRATLQHIEQTAKSIQNVGLSTHKVAVDGTLVAPQGYLVDRENYFKLRDVAYILNGTDAQFNVEWDKERNSIVLTSGEVYEAVGGEMAPSSTEVEYIAASDSDVLYEGKNADMTGYRINGNNYYRIRDVAQVIGFDVDFDNDTRTVQISSHKSGSAQDPEQIPGQDPEDKITPGLIPQSYTFDGTGWGHSVGMSQYGALGMAKQGKNYKEILQFYYTDIEIASES